jgi:small-conductance mechanosensitive channel
VAEEDFEGLLPDEDAKKFFSYLQMHTGCENEKAQVVSRQQFVVFFESIQQEKSNLLKCVSDQENIIKQLNSGCLAVVFIIWAAFCYPKFVLILFPLLYVVNSVFYDVLQEVVNAGAFVFFKHPFDVGDSIYLAKCKYKVASIDFMTSTLLGPDGGIVYMNNCELDKYLIYNIRRAEFQYENFTLSLHPAITLEQMNEFEAEMKAFIHKNPQDYRDQFQLWGFQIVNSHRLDVTITLRYASNKHLGDSYAEKKTKFQLKVKNTLERLRIPLSSNQF